MNGLFTERSCGESHNGLTSSRDHFPVRQFSTQKECIMSNRIKKSAIALTLGGAVAMAGLAFAQPAQVTSAPVATLAQATVAPTAAAGEKNQWLNLRQIYDRIEATGYTDIREIERERDGYEAKARNAQGQSVKLYIEPLEGRIVREKTRDRD